MPRGAANTAGKGGVWVERQTIKGNLEFSVLKRRNEKEEEFREEPNEEVGICFRVNLR
jgi:hypothetical protein